MPQSIRYARVAVSGPFCRTFTYSVRPDLEALSPGQRVIVPFGRRSMVGYYLGLAEQVKGIEIKAIQRALDPASFVPPDLFSLCIWVAEYYLANPADCLSLALPTAIRNRTTVRLIWSNPPKDTPDSIRRIVRPGKAVKSEELKYLRSKHRLSTSSLISRGMVEEVWPSSGESPRPRVSGYRLASAVKWDEFIAGRRSRPQPFEGERTRADLLALGWTGHLLSVGVKEGLLEPVIREASDRSFEMIQSRVEVKALSLTTAQRTVLGRLVDSLGAGFGTFLLHGITGSGKTLVYCHLALEALNREKTVLVLTPEIALAGTMLGYLRGFFGDRIAIMHSAMSERARLENWNAIRSGKHPIVVGPRSALFAPLPNLGLIIVDEEHDGSYKQDDPSPRFHGRDAAIMRARLNKIPVLLGSASPSVESYHQAKSGKYTLLELTERPAGARLPTVRVVDLREDRLGGDLLFMSYALKKEVDRRLAQDEQVILFLNRRGYASMLKCGSCGHVPNCPSCEIHMTYHKAGGGRLACHYCGLVRRDYSVCEKCGGRNFLYLGTGTQKLEESIARLFENARPLRFDSDAAAGEFGAHQMLSDFAAHKYNLLLGTQMVTKGLDLPKVSLVGVLSADHGMDLPDFRASEKTFARLLQVAGRSGRTEREGEVIIQTYDPENEIITLAARQDYSGFFEREIGLRKEHEFPPFTRLVNVEISGKAEEQVSRETIEFRQRLEDVVARSQVSIEILGPAPCPHYFVKGVYRRHLLVKTRQMSRLSRLLAEWEVGEARFGLPSSVNIRVDVDPIDLM
jgi:primosomal protein N' (replication factor Y)